MESKRGGTAHARKKRILIVDDHAVVREGLAQLINREPDLMVCADVDSVPAALEAIRQLHPDAAIVDIALNGMNGLQLTKIIATQHKKVAVLVLSMYDERVYAERALHAGAKGYIMKQEAGKKVILAVRQVLAGNIYLSEEISAWVLHKLVGKAAVPAASPLDALTDRELEVFELIGQGLKPGEISERLHLSVKTIETHREHLKNKLNLANAAELVQHAIAWVHSQQFQ